VGHRANLDTVVKRKIQLFTDNNVKTWLGRHHGNNVEEQHMECYLIKYDLSIANKSEYERRRYVFWALPPWGKVAGT
jgi:hypothetical protein